MYKNCVIMQNFKGIISTFLKDGADNVSKSIVNQIIHIDAKLKAT